MPAIEVFEKYMPEYERWFRDNQAVYLSELNAIRQQLPCHGEGVEIGVGTARFAVPLGIEYGVEPSPRMGQIAKQRGVHVIRATGENLPLADAQFDVALMVTTICFLDDVRTAFEEVHRILRAGGIFVVGFVDRGSLLGELYERQKETSVFYSAATFYSIKEVLQLLKQSGFRNITTVQTIFRPLAETITVEPVKPGYGEGSFLVVRGLK